MTDYEKLKIAKEQLREQRQTNRFLERIANALEIISETKKDSDTQSDKAVDGLTYEEWIEMSRAEAWGVNFGDLLG